MFEVTLVAHYRGSYKIGYVHELDAYRIIYTSETHGAWIALGQRQTHEGSHVIISGDITWMDEHYDRIRRQCMPSL